LFARLFYSNLLSTSAMIIVLWIGYTFSRSATPLVVTSALLVSAGIAGTIVFAHDLLAHRPSLSREQLGFLLLMSFAVILLVVSAVSLPFSVQGDAYSQYVPLGRYLNRYPGAYVDSYYRFSLSRDFAYYAVYAHADFLGGSFGSYLFLPVPFVLGAIFGLVSLSKRLTSEHTVPLIATTCFVFSVFFGLILKYNMFYLGNLQMISIALFYCYFLLKSSGRVIDQLALPFSTFAMLLLYDYTLLLLVPFAFGYLALRKPRLAFYVAAGLAAALFLVFSQQSVTLDFIRVQQLDFQSSIAFLALLTIVLVGLRGKANGRVGPSSTIYPVILTYLAAAASLLVQRIVNQLTYGFMSLSNYALSSPVIGYIQRTGWFYVTTPNIANTIFSFVFSDIFFGWGLFFTAYGLYMNRGKPVATFLLTALPLTVLVETVNNNYFRYASFLAPLVILFLAIGLQTLLRRNALLLGVSLSFVAILERAITVYPNLDYEHMAIASSLDISLLGATVLSAATVHFLSRQPRSKFMLLAIVTKVRRWTLKLHSVGSIGWRGIASALILILCIPIMSYSVLTYHYPDQTYNTVANYVDQHVLPLIQDRTTVLTAELIHPNFNFYKDVVVLELAQPWILESFLRLHIANVTGLVTWLSSNGIKYVFVDRTLTAGNQDVFGLFDQLSSSCGSPSQCSSLFDDGRFVLLQIG
jgi:hypothetical protein